jgi:membrane protein HdeD
MQGISTAFARGLDRSAEAINVVAAVLSMAAGVAIVTWPLLGLVAVAVSLGAWLVMMGTMTLTGAFAARDVIQEWWLWLILGLLEIPLGVFALADPGATLATLISVGGTWAVAVGVMHVVIAFQLKRLPDPIDALATTVRSGKRSGGEMRDADSASARAPA